jgi:hypothetical protein
MKSKFILTLFIGLLICSSSCDKDGDIDSTILNGEYEGIFTVEYNSQTYSNPVTVSFNSGQFLSSSGPNRFPAGGSGKYEVLKNTIEFTDENFWTADFDWNLILNGSYDYSIKGNELVFSANKNDVGFYKYELKKK